MKNGKLSALGIVVILFATTPTDSAGMDSPAAAKQTGVWTISHQWSQTWEDAFSNWVAHLFRPLPGDANRSWRRLHVVLRNPQRNSLYNALGLGEDDPRSTHRVRAVADCGDLPYLLRAYFAWKTGLPFRYSETTRGTSRGGPEYLGELDNRTTRFDQYPHPVKRFNKFVEVMTWKVHSGTLRTLPTDERSDFYPIPISREAILPGTVFVDPGGHVLMVTQWDENGLYGVDGHPDKTVTRRPFNPRFFPYYQQLETGGFKGFRPFRAKGTKLAPMTNQELSHQWSRMQYDFPSGQDFYGEMNRLLQGAPSAI